MVADEPSSPPSEVPHSLNRVAPAAGERLPQWLVYLLTLTTSVAASLLRLALGILPGEQSGMMVFLLPIILSAYLGGLGPGLLATALAAIQSGAFVLSWFSPAFSATPTDYLRSASLISAGVLISVLSESLLAAKQRFALIAAITPGAVHAFRLEADGKAYFPYASPGIGAIFGLSLKELSVDASAITRMTHPQDCEHVRASIAESARLLTPWHCEYRLLHPTRGEIWVEGHSVPQRERDGSTTWYGIFIDATERKRVEAKARSHALHLEVLADASRAFAEAGPGYQAVLDQVTRTTAQVLGDNCGVRLLAADGIALEVVAMADVVSEAGAKFQELFRAVPIRADGDSLSARVLRSGQPLLLGKYRTQLRVLESTPDLVAWLEQIGVHSAILTPLRTRGQVIGLLYLMRHQASSPPFDADDLRLAQDLADRAALAISNARLFENVQVELELRRQAEEQLRYQAGLLQNVSDAIIATDPDFVITSWNRGAELIYGWTASEAIGRRIENLIPPDYLEERPELVLEHFFQNGFWKGEVCQKHKDGRTLTILASISAIKDSTSRISGAVAVNRDITERKQAAEAQARLEAQLRQAQKLESIGRLAGGVAHDFNNLLTVIQGYSDLVLGQLSPTDPLRDDVEQILQASARATAVTRQLLAFSRKQVLNLAVIDLNTLIGNLQRMLERVIGEDITLTTDLQPGLWPVRADAGQLEQVLLNLVVNARQAMPSGGRLTITTQNIRADAERAVPEGYALNDRLVCITVSDTGCGMDTDVQSRIFEPFFTTKAPGEGTGLGLAMAYGIITQSGGEISVESVQGEGSSFRILLPVCESNSDEPAQQPQHAGSHSGSGTILLVEDEAQVRSLVRKALEQSGYQVLEASNGQEALAKVAQYEVPLDLLITDVVMPVLGGRLLAEQLRAKWPDLKILFISGYADDLVLPQDVVLAGIAFMAKPFTPTNLAVRVRELLDG